MKKTVIKFTGALLGSLALLSSCKKDFETIYTMFDDVEVTYHADSPYSVTDYKVVQPGDSVYLDFTITSKNKNMYMVCVKDAGAAIPFLKIPLEPGQRRSFSYTAKLQINKVGRTSYRVWALDSAGVFIGDGYKTVTVDVASDINYWSNRYAYVPDTLGMSNKCYINLRSGELYSYNEAKNMPDSVDAGIAFNPTSNGGLGSFVVYALDASPNPFTPYDISAWPKRAVRFSSLKKNQASQWVRSIPSGATLKSNAGSNPTNKSVEMSYKSGNNLVTGGNAVYFKTPEGKYGGLIINYTTGNTPNKEIMVNIDIKIQK